MSFRPVSKPRYRWSYALHVWVLQGIFRLTPTTVWPSHLMPQLVERRPGESDVSVAQRWRTHFDVDASYDRRGRYDA